LCERCNYVKEAPGWRVGTGADDAGRHVADFCTPTGAHYHATAPPLPRPAVASVSEIETRIDIAIAELHAA
jgi:hypothetical protein